MIHALSRLIHCARTRAKGLLVYASRRVPNPIDIEFSALLQLLIEICDRPKQFPEAVASLEACVHFNVISSVNDVMDGLGVGTI